MVDTVRYDLRDGMLAREFGAYFARHPVIVEVGANDGDTTQDFLEAFPTARLVAFEPDARAIAKFRRRDFPTAQVSLLECAIGATNGEVTFHHSGGAVAKEHDWDRSGSILPPGNALRHHDWLRFERTSQVPLRRLDDALRPFELPRIDLLWMDVQGAEAEVLAGATETLARTRLVYLEYSDTEDYEGQVVGVDALAAHLPGFEIVEVMRHDVLFRSRRPALRAKRLHNHLHAARQRANTLVRTSPLTAPLRRLRRVLLKRLGGA